MFWDYLSSNPESLYQVLRLMSDLGTPYGFRHMNAWTGHSYRWIKGDGSWVYVKLYAESMQGVSRRYACAYQDWFFFHFRSRTSLTPKQPSSKAQILTLQLKIYSRYSSLPSSFSFINSVDIQSIQNGTFPGWTLYAQVLTPKQAETFKYNVLDLTKYAVFSTTPERVSLEWILIFELRDWGFDDVPKTEIGKFYLTQNPDKSVFSLLYSTYRWLIPLI